MPTFYSPAEVVGLAVETERAGQHYYELAAGDAKTAKVKELFAFLAGQEIHHRQLFEGLYRKIKETPAELPQNWDETVPYLKVITDSRFFLGDEKAINLVRAAKDEQEAVEFALQFEKETLLFYLEIGPLVADVHRPVVEDIAAQERLHIRRLSELKTGKQGS